MCLRYISMSSGRNPAGNWPESGRNPAGIRPDGRAGGRAVGLLFFWEKHVPGFLEHVFCGFCDFWAISRSPGKKIKIWPIWSNDYARKTRIEILCKKTCYNAPYHFFKVWFLKQFLDFANLGLNVNLKNRGRPKGGPKILVYIYIYIRDKYGKIPNPPNRLHLDFSHYMAHGRF